MRVLGQEDNSWALEEMGTVKLGDERLNKRVVQVLEQLGERPSPSIPTACRGWAETMAAYRLFDNEKVTMESVLAAHERAAVARIEQHPIVLCIEDTTEVDYSTKKETKGLGPLTYKARQGLFLHPTLAVTPDRVPLGCLRAFVWSREMEFHGKKKASWKRAITEKESFRWIEGYRRVNEVAGEVPQTQLVYVADRESDIYELFVEAQTRQGQRADLLIRAKTDRNLFDGGKLRAAVEKSLVLGTVEFDLGKRDKQPGRRVVQTLRAARVKLKTPCHKDKKLPNHVELTVILAKEEQPPSGVEPVEWLLLTTRSVTTLEEAAQMMQWYLCRWQIEVFFHILKNGCKIEKLQLEHIDRLKPAIALYMIIAWRVLHLTMLGRKCPNLSCEAVFDAEEWQAVYVVTKRTRPPQKPPRLDEMVKMIASYGGYLNRQGDGEPGPKTLWIGLQRVRDFVLGINAQKELQR